MNILKKAKENPKISITLIITILLNAYDLISANATILGIDTKTMAYMSLIISIISMVWKSIKPEQSVFSMMFKHVGTRPKNPPNDDDNDEDDNNNTITGG
jgi:hypothetical protein